MNLVLLSGGSGQRLWPLSNDIRSKQFIKIFHREDGELESMVQRVYRQIKAVDTDAPVTIDRWRYYGSAPGSVRSYLLRHRRTDRSYHPSDKDRAGQRP